MKILAERPGRMVHNPSSNMDACHGVRPRVTSAQRECSRAWATDPQAANNDLKMMDEHMDMAARCRKPIAPTPRAGRKGAWKDDHRGRPRQCHGKRSGGSLEDGKKADSSSLRSRYRTPLHMYDVLLQLVYALKRARSTVMSAAENSVRGRQALNVDEPAASAKARE